MSLTQNFVVNLLLIYTFVLCINFEFRMNASEEAAKIAPLTVRHWQ